jgi:hypothetical protein
VKHVKLILILATILFQSLLIFVIVQKLHWNRDTIIECRRGFLDSEMRGRAMCEGRQECLDWGEEERVGRWKRCLGRGYW